VILDVRTNRIPKKQDLESMEDMQGLPSLSPAAKPGCHNGNEVLHCPEDDAIFQQLPLF